MVKVINNVIGILGNTIPQTHDNINKTSKKNRWCFTFNNYTNDEYRRLVDWCNITCKYWIIGKENDLKCKTSYLQGYFNLKYQMRFTELKKMLNPKISFRSCKGGEASNAVYYSKSGEYTQKGLDKYIKDINLPVKTIQNLRPFQIELRDYILNHKPDRKILWVYDEKGQIGKTEFLKYMNINYKIPFSCGSNYSDIINIVFSNKNYFINTDIGAVIYNFDRYTKADKISYTCMEQIADGCISNTKVNAGCFVCNYINIIVLASCHPDKSKMADYRLIIKTIDDNFNLIDYIEPKNNLVV